MHLNFIKHCEGHRLKDLGDRIYNDLQFWLVPQYHLLSSDTFYSNQAIFHLLFLLNFSIALTFYVYEWPLGILLYILQYFISAHCQPHRGFNNKSVTIQIISILYLKNVLFSSWKYINDENEI